MFTVILLTKGLPLAKLWPFKTSEKKYYHVAYLVGGTEHSVSLFTFYVAVLFGTRQNSLLAPQANRQRVTQLCTCYVNVSDKLKRMKQV